MRQNQNKKAQAMKKTAVLFPGQGSQYVSMGTRFSDQSIFRGTMDLAFEILGGQFKTAWETGPIEVLSRTQFTQPIVYAVSYAYYMLITESYRITPALLAGHSLGELTALTCAGAISFEDGLALVKKRGELMAIGSPGGMAAVIGLDLSLVMKICESATKGDEFAAPANINSSTQIVISGTPASLESVKSEVGEQGGKYMPLNVSAAFHSRFMEKPAVEFNKELKKYRFRELRIPVLSNLDARYYESPNDIPARLTAQLTSPVQWKEIMDRIEEEEIQLCLESGPKNVLKKLLEKEKPAMQILAIDEEKDFNQLEGICFNYHETLALCIKHAITLRNNLPFSPQYENDFRLQFKKLAVDFYNLKDNQPASETVVYGIGLLNKAFEIKGTPDEERAMRLNEIARSITDESLLKTLSHSGLLNG
jgi:[acyl-carrier-protein] S-malonyltransferase